MTMRRLLGAGGGLVLVLGAIYGASRLGVTEPRAVDLSTAALGTSPATMGVSRQAPTTMPSSTQTEAASPRVPVQPTSTPLPEVSFPVGPGSVDVIPHQIVRTSDDRLFIFAGYPYSKEVNAYWTDAPGLPDSLEAFAGHSHIETPADPLSVDAAYGGGRWIVILVNEQDGELRAYPFDTLALAFLQPMTIAQKNPTVDGDYLGTSGVSGMFDAAGILHVAYWGEGDHIDYQSFTLDMETGRLERDGGPKRLDTDGSANHPILATGPDNSLTVAWISESTPGARIDVRTRDASGAWAEIESVSRGPVWHSSYFGVNIDQGPSLVVDGMGVRHLAYIEDYGTAGEYGRVHYVVGSEGDWHDQALSIWSHDPALVVRAPGQLVLIGHGHPENSTCKRMDDICFSTLDDSGAWSDPISFAIPPDGASFDSSPSVKWSGAPAGLVRPETVEFAFFSTPYNAPTVFYGRLP